MKAKLTFNSVSIVAAASRAMIGNVEHMVVPVICIREGVLNDIFYPESELSAVVAAWNGVPIPVSHPKDSEGNHVTANSADAESNHNIGRFFDASFDKKTKALKGNLWIDIEKAKLLGHQSLMDRLDKAENVDVSTGLWTNAESAPGEYQGKKYSHTARGITPDHLAILPNEKGACSVNDGCGTFLLNHKEGEHCCDDCASKAKPKEDKVGMFGNAFKRISKAFGFLTNEQSHNELHHKLSKQLRSNNAGNWQYIVDVFPKFFVYEQDDSLFKQTYKINADETIEFDNSPVQVMVKRNYEELPLKLKSNSNNNMKPKYTVFLAALLAANTITQEQHESMKTLPEPILDDLIKANEKAPEAAVVAPIANSEGTISPDERLLLNELKAEREQRTTNLRTHLKANVKSIPEVVIDSMTLVQLEQTLSANSGKPLAVVTDFSAGAGAPLQANSSEQSYVAPSILLGAAKSA